jgi:hypothetical protein
LTSIINNNANNVCYIDSLSDENQTAEAFTRNFASYNTIKTTESDYHMLNPDHQIYSSPVLKTTESDYHMLNPDHQRYNSLVLKTTESDYHMLNPDHQRYNSPVLKTTESDYPSLDNVHSFENENSDYEVPLQYSTESVGF